MVVLTTQGQPMETVMSLPVFLYSCLKLERQAQMACLEEEQTEQSMPPEMIAATETVTATWPPRSRGQSCLIMRVGVKQFTFITRICSSQLVYQVFLGITIPALQINKFIAYLRSNRNLISSFTELSSDRSAYLHSHSPPADTIAAFVASNRSALRSIIRKREWCLRASQRAICRPIPMHPPVITIRLDWSSLSGFFLKTKEKSRCSVRMAAARYPGIWKRNAQIESSI